RLLDEIRLDEMRAGLDRRAELKGVESLLRPLFPAQLCALRPADDRRPHPRLIEADVELLRFRGEPHDAAVGAALLQPQLEQVLAGNRKLVANCQSTARSPRHILAPRRARVAAGRDEVCLWRLRSANASQRHLTDSHRRSE